MIDQIIEYYTNLLIIQYNNKPKARATISAFVKALLADNITIDVRDGYDLDTAVGKQLDILGKYIGINRFYTSDKLTEDYFGFENAISIGNVSSNIVGFDDSDVLNKSGGFLDATEVISSDLVLNDDAYRKLLKLKIVQNYSDHSTKSISESLFAFFDGNINISDNYNMTITYLIGDQSSALLEVVLDKKVLPRPMGVELKTIIKGNRAFGFADAENDNVPDYVVGFNDADVGFTQEGGFLDSFRDII